MSDVAASPQVIGAGERRKDEIASVAGQISHLSNGGRAALRRAYLVHARATEGIIVGLLHRAGVAEAGWRSERAFARWRLLAHVAALLSGTAETAPHAPSRPFGRALHEAGYSENRLMRLTAARGPALVDQIVRAARFLAQAGAAPVDLHVVYNLASDDPARAEAARLRIARDYYAADHASAGDTK